MNPATKPKICIVAHYAYGAMLGGHRGHVGGVERQTSLTARWLAARGYEVSLLTYDEGGPREQMIDGVRVISMCKLKKGLPGFRFVHPRMTSLFSSLKLADADVYYHNCAEYHTGLIAWWCRKNKRKFVYSTAHDNDCDTALPALPKLYERVLYRYGIRHADRLIVQTELQRQLMKKSFGYESISLPMPCPGPLPSEYVEREFPANPTVSWVGRAVWDKRPEWIFDIAERMPDVTFEVAAGNMQKSEYGDGLIARANSLKNLRWLGGVVREEMPKLYQRALCLCSTSISEGFPNTFLEAWSHGTPLVTTFDPDGLVASQNLGKAITDVAGAVVAIREMIDHPDRWKTMSNNARRHYEKYHLVDTAIARFEQTFLSVCAADRSSDPERALASNSTCLT
jgi:glycosyltransferase involved in cell wall biosynthesis